MTCWRVRLPSGRPILLMMVGLAVLLGTPGWAVEIELPQLCRFSCPDGWQVTQSSSRSGEARVSCVPPGTGVCAMLDIRFTPSRAYRGTKDLRGRIKKERERIFKAEAFLGRKAYFAWKKDLTSIYFPVKKGYFRVAYTAPTQAFKKDSEELLAVLRSFTLDGPCDAGKGGKEVELSPDELPPSTLKVRKREGARPDETSYRSSRTGTSAAETRTRLYEKRDSCLLVVSVYPEELLGQRAHFEVHYTVGRKGRKRLLKDVKAILVRVQDPEDNAGRLNSLELRHAAIPYEEQVPDTARLDIYSLQPWAGHLSDNRAVLRKAVFPDPGIGKVRLAYDVTGIQADVR